MNRRDFLCRSSAYAAAAALFRGKLLGQGAPTAMTTMPPPARLLGAGFTQFTPLRRNVGIFTGRGGTIGWLAATDGLAIIDTQFPDSAAICLAGFPGRGDRKIDVVLNTHHHADHTSGNPTFRPVAKTIVAQANVPKLQFEAADRAEKDPKAQSWARLDQQVYADTTFAEAWRHELGDEVITAQYYGPAHTNGDAIIMFEKANVVHVGDLMFNRLYPVIDQAAGASARGWVAVLEKIVKVYPADAIYICGHGNTKFGVTGRRDDLLVMRDYWTAVIAFVEKGIAAGKSRAEVESLANLPGFEPFHAAPPNRLTGNLAAVYDELTQKKA
jgi:cyclase